MGKLAMTLGLVAAASLAGAPALAGSKEETRRYDATDAIYDQYVMGASGVRFPGDVATPVGNYHVRGGKKIPYIERCRWTFEMSDVGLPRHFRYVCRRYYGEPIN